MCQRQVDPACPIFPKTLISARHEQGSTSRKGCPTMDRWRFVAFAGILTGICCASGCSSLRPRNFRDMLNPAPVVRAGAVGLGENQPDAIAIPAWIQGLDDKDAVVRMTANENLKTRTRQDFGFIAWGEPEQRAPAVAKWKAWWAEKSKSQPAVASQDGLVRSRRKR